MGTAVSLAAEAGLRECNVADRGTVDDQHYDIGVAVAVNGAPVAGSRVYAQAGPSAGVLHLYGEELVPHVRARVRGWPVSPGVGARASGPVCNGLATPAIGFHGLLAPDQPAGIVAQVAAGIAFATKTRRTGATGAVVTLQPRAVTSTGAWHEAVSFSTATHTPLVVVMEPTVLLGSELSGTGSPQAPSSHMSPAVNLAARAKAYGAGYDRAEADPLSVLAATRSALVRATNEGRTQFLELTPGRAYPGGDLARLRACAASLAAPRSFEWRAMEDNADRLVARALTLARAS